MSEGHSCLSGCAWGLAVAQIVPPPRKQRVLRAAWRLHPDLQACSTRNGARRSALLFLQGGYLEDSMLNVQDASFSSDYENPGAVSVRSWPFHNLKRERLKTTTLEVKHIWPLEEAGFRFPLWSSAWAWIVIKITQLHPRRQASTVAGSMRLWASFIHCFFCVQQFRSDCPWPSFLRKNYDLLIPSSLSCNFLPPVV